MQLLRHIAAVLVLVLAGSVTTVHAQEEGYRFDMGVAAGMSGYLGDLNEGNPFRSPGFTAGAIFGYRPDARWELRTALSVSTLSGDSKNFPGTLPEDLTYNFKSTVYDLSERVEFNFFSYGIGETYKRLRRWSPYLTAGVGMALATCQGESAIAFEIPLGMGVRYKIAPRWNLGLEFTMTKAFSDHLDGAIADLYRIKSSFLKNTDWYSRLQLTLTYEFGPRCPTCHYYD